MRNEIENRSEIQGLTYYDDATNEDEIPYQVLLPRELGIAFFHLAKIVIYEVCVKEHTEVFRGYQEACHKSMDRWGKLKEHRIMEDEAIHRQHASVDSNGREEYGCGNRPIE